MLLHAIGTSMRMWAPQVPVLSRDHRVISIDLRGHGQSPAPLGPYAMDELARDVIAVLDRLEIERASICGLSLGAMVGHDHGGVGARPHRPAHRCMRRRGPDVADRLA